MGSDTQQCVKKQNIPSQVSQVSQHQHSQVYSKHLVEERQNKICFSARSVRSPNTSTPKSTASISWRKDRTRSASQLGQSGLPTPALPSLQQASRGGKTEQDLLLN